MIMQMVKTTPLKTCDIYSQISIYFVKNQMRDRIQFKKWRTASDELE